ncbi:hypothetical protein IAU59_004095 [Kwoniella sp. CBS 9459]
MSIQTLRPTKVGFSNPRVVPATTVNSKIKWDTLTGNVSMSLQADGGSLDLEIKRDQAVMLSRSFRLLAEAPQALRKITWKDRQASIRYEAGTALAHTNNKESSGHEVIQLIFASAADVQSLIRAVEGYFSIIAIGQAQTNGPSTMAVTSIKARSTSINVKKKRDHSASAASQSQLTSAINRPSQQQARGDIDHPSGTASQRLSTSLADTASRHRESQTVTGNKKAEATPTPVVLAQQTPSATENLSSSKSADKKIEHRRSLTDCDSTEDLKQRLLQGFKPSSNANTDTDNLTPSSVHLRAELLSIPRYTVAQLPISSDRSQADPRISPVLSNAEALTAPALPSLSDSPSTDRFHAHNSHQDPQTLQGIRIGGGQATDLLQESLIIFSPVIAFEQRPQQKSEEVGSTDRITSTASLSLPPSAKYTSPPSAIDHSQYLTETQILASELTFEELYPALVADSTGDDRGSKKRKRDELDEEDEEEKRELEKLDMHAASLAIETTESFKAQSRAAPRSANLPHPSISGSPREHAHGNSQEALDTKISRIVDGKLEQFHASLEGMFQRYLPAMSSMHTNSTTHQHQAPYHPNPNAYIPHHLLNPQNHWWQPSMVSPIPDTLSWYHPQNSHKSFPPLSPPLAAYPSQVRTEEHNASPTLYTRTPGQSARAPLSIFSGTHGVAFRVRTELQLGFDTRLVGWSGSSEAQSGRRRR